MLVRDVMTYNVVTVPSGIPIFEAERLLEAHKFERLPVVDTGKPFSGHVSQPRGTPVCSVQIDRQRDYEDECRNGQS